MASLPFANDARVIQASLDYLRSDAPEPLRRALQQLAERLDAQWIGTGAAAKLLGVSSRNTVKNWLEGGHFPSARQTPGGQWRFLRREVVAVREAMQALSDAPVDLGALELPLVEEGDAVEGLG